jgi:nitrogen fixation NifU-like protein
MGRFSDTLLDHARHPRNFGRDDSASVVGRGDLDGRPPRVEIFLRLERNAISRASFVAGGCGVTVGACSALTEMILGLVPAEAKKISTSQLDAALDGTPVDKRYCLDVAIAALRNALRTTLIQ